MPPRPFVNDALWRCLCPSFASNLARNGKNFTASTPARAVAKITSCPTRAYHDSNPHLSTDEFTSFAKPSSSFQSLDQSSIFGHRKPHRTTPLAQLPTDVLYEHVRTEGAKGNWEQVMNICRVLIRDRGQLPNKEMYTALLHSFVSSENGTAGKARKVLEEMGFWDRGDGPFGAYGNVELDARGCECILEVLAVHPDYLLRSEILEYMKSRWFTVTPRAENFIVAGLLRERHFEHALERLEDMMGRNVRVERWLVDKTLWILLEFGEVEEAFRLLGLFNATQDRSGTGSIQLSEALWSSLLDAAADKQLHEPLATIWTTQVEPGYLKPSTGTCLTTLAVASLHGNLHLATDVFRVLTERETTFTTHHYELLIATYLGAGDLPSALSAILIMADAQMKVDTGSCNPLYLHLISEKSEENSRPLQAFGLLQNFEAEGRKVPTDAVNACIQASISLDRFEEAVEIYKVLHTVSHAGPNTNTFNILFRGCHLTGRKELAMFFVNEMIQLGLKPDAVTYDRLILVCRQSGDLDDALLYYEEMRSNGWKPRPRTWELLIFTCVSRGEDRAVALLRDYKAGVEEPRKRIEKAVVDRFEYGIMPGAAQGEAAGPTTSDTIGTSGFTDSDGPALMQEGVPRGQDRIKLATNESHSSASEVITLDLKHYAQGVTDTGGKIKP